MICRWGRYLETNLFRCEYETHVSPHAVGFGLMSGLDARTLHCFSIIQSSAVLVARRRLSLAGRLVSSQTALDTAASNAATVSHWPPLISTRTGSVDAPFA